MAGDWIKMRVWIRKDPRVASMADYLATDRNFINYITDPVRRQCGESAYEHITSDVTRAITVASLIEIWGVARERGDRDGDDLVLDHCEISNLDDICSTPTMGEAMEYVEWAKEEIIQRNGREVHVVRFPKFFKENESPEDRYRKQHASAQATYRAKQKGKKASADADKSDTKRDVTRDVTSDVTMTPREEKRIEEKKEEKNPLPLKDENEVADAFASIGVKDNPSFRQDIAALWERLLPIYRQANVNGNPEPRDFTKRIEGAIAAYPKTDRIVQAAKWFFTAPRAVNSRGDGASFSTFFNNLTAYVEKSELDGAFLPSKQSKPSDDSTPKKYVESEENRYLREQTIKNSAETRRLMEENRKARNAAK